MRARRAPASAFAAVLLAVAVSLLGVRLFLPGSASACAPAESACCCGTEIPSADGCGCSISPATPVPVAALAPVDGVAPPALAGRAVDVTEGLVPVAPPAGARTPPRARSAPTQALLETFRI